ncbi:MAG: hypothetical protein OHK0013_03530 [Sandaracinaceae bacterium]
MTLRQGAERRRRPVVLVFGESENDTGAIKRLTRALRPDLDADVEVRRTPLVLIKGALPERAAENADEIANVAKSAAKIRPVLAVLAHQDCDAVEPAHEEAAELIENGLRNAGCPGVPIAVTPAWETETWWMVFPEAVGAVVQGWREPDDWIGKDVGKVEKSKEKLASAVQPRPKRKDKAPRAYRESDSIAIADNIATSGSLTSFEHDARVTHASNGSARRTRCASFGRFRARVLAISSRRG